MSFGQQMYWVGPPVPGVYESAAGYGQPVLPASPEAAAQQLCAIMGGSWSADSLECAVGDTTYKLPDFTPGAMPSGSCGPDEVMTPQGCKPFPGGDEPPVPPPPNGPPPSNGPGPPPAEPETPSWVLPAAIAGIAGIAVIALVMTK
jgi:hypothetical protein